MVRLQLRFFIAINGLHRIQCKALFTRYDCDCDLSIAYSGCIWFNVIAAITPCEHLYTKFHTTHLLHFRIAIVLYEQTFKFSHGAIATMTLIPMQPIGRNHTV